MLSGGDTDTIGSMVGGLIGTLNGYSIWPDHLATNVHEYENLLVVADSFLKTCNERNREMGAKQTQTEIEVRIQLLNLILAIELLPELPQFWG